MKVTIDYINECGLEGHAEILDPMKIDHVWYDSKRNPFGKYDKHEVTVLGAFLGKLKNCTKIRLVQE